MPRIIAPFLGLAVGAAAVAAAVQSARTRRVRRRIKWAVGAGASHDGALHARSLGDGTAGVLLLHGLGGSNAYWGATYDALAGTGRLIVPDLLGFGLSPRPSSGYTASDHVDALTGLLGELGITGPIVVGAHSFGCLVALALAEQRPDLVAGVVGFCPPLYPDAVTVITRAADVLGRFRSAGDPKPGSVAGTDDDRPRPGHHCGHEL